MLVMACRGPLWPAGGVVCAPLNGGMLLLGMCGRAAAQCAAPFLLPSTDAWVDGAGQRAGDHFRGGLQAAQQPAGPGAGGAACLLRLHLLVCGTGMLLLLLLLLVAGVAGVAAAREVVLSRRCLLRCLALQAMHRSILNVRPLLCCLQIFHTKHTTRANPSER